jgi:hypothetical protein
MEVINNLFNQFNTFDQIVAQVKTDIDGIVADLQTTINDKIDAAINSQDTIDQVVEAMGDEQTAQDNKISALETSQSAQDDSISAVESAQLDQANRIATLENFSNNASASLSSLQDSLSQLQTLVNTTKALADSNKTRLDDIDAQLVQMTDDIANAGGGGGTSGTGDVSSELIEELLGAGRYTKEGGINSDYRGKYGNAYVKEGYMESGYIEQAYKLGDGQVEEYVDEDYAEDYTETSVPFFDIFVKGLLPSTEGDKTKVILSERVNQHGFFTGINEIIDYPEGLSCEKIKAVSVWINGEKAQHSVMSGCDIQVYPLGEHSCSTGFVAGDYLVIEITY